MIIFYMQILLINLPKIEEYLKDTNVKNKVIQRAYRNTPLTNKQHKENYKYSKTRVRVEHIFGTLKTSMN